MKKKTFIFILLITVCGCAQQMYTHIDKSEIISSLDFTRYKNNNFLITPGDYGEDYEALGIFTFTVYPEANYHEEKYQTSDGTTATRGKWIEEKIFAQDILDLAYETAIKSGADGITHLKISNKSKMMNDGKNNFVLDGLEMEGLLINRKK